MRIPHCRQGGVEEQEGEGGEHWRSQVGNGRWCGVKPLPSKAGLCLDRIHTHRTPCMSDTHPHRQRERVGKGPCVSGKGTQLVGTSIGSCQTWNMKFERFQIEPIDFWAEHVRPAVIPTPAPCCVLRVCAVVFVLKYICIFSGFSAFSIHAAQSTSIHTPSCVAGG